MKCSILEVDLASIYNLPIRPVEHIISSLWSSNVFLSASSGVLVLKVKRCICRIAMFAAPVIPMHNMQIMIMFHR
jgi:hypothetical protein